MYTNANTKMQIYYTNENIIMNFVGNEGESEPWKRFWIFVYVWTGGERQGRNHGWKVEEDQGLGSNTWALAPRARPKGRLGVGW